MNRRQLRDRPERGKQHLDGSDDPDGRAQVLERATAAYNPGALGRAADVHGERPAGRCGHHLEFRGWLKLTSDV